MEKIIGFIGCGNMGEAILQGIADNHRVCVYEKNAKRANLLKRKYKVEITDLSSTVQKSGILILAVKPQDFEAVLKQIKECLKPKTVVVSIAAGITTKYIQKQLGKIKVVRVMPNLPAVLQQGVTALTAGTHAGAHDVKAVQKLFKTVGSTVILSERLMDSLTAVSGSGPAYVFLFAECMIKAAESLGLKKAQARELVLQTMKGSITLLEKTKEPPQSLRAKVTSKGGTTEAALRVFTANKLDAIFLKALKAAQKRAKELSK